MYHSADSQPVTDEVLIILDVRELPRYVYTNQSECFMLLMLFIVHCLWQRAADVAHWLRRWNGLPLGRPGFGSC